MKAEQTIHLITTLLTLALTLPLHAGELAEAIQSKRLQGGVILLANAGREAYDDAAASGCTVRGLETDAAVVDSLRKHLQEKGVYGRISVAEFDGEVLPCIDGLVNIVLVGDGDVPQAELMRILAP